MLLGDGLDGAGAGTLELGGLGGAGGVGVEVLLGGGVVADLLGVAGVVLAGGGVPVAARDLVLSGCGVVVLVA